MPYFFLKHLRKISQILSSAVVIGAVRVYMLKGQLPHDMALLFL